MKLDVRAFQEPFQIRINLMLFLASTNDPKSPVCFYPGALFRGLTLMIARSARVQTRFWQLLGLEGTREIRWIHEVSSRHSYMVTPGLHLDD